MTNPMNETTVVEANSNPFHLGLKDLWAYRDLTWLFVKRNLSTQYKQTVLGPAWLVISPLAISLIFTFVFGQYVGLSTDDTPQFLFFLSGFSLWNLFNTGVVNISGTFMQNSAIFGKVYFPRLTVPVSQIITSLINFLIQLVILFGFYFIEIIRNKPGYISFKLLLIPVLVLQCALLAFGVGLLIAALTTRYRDLALALTFGMQLWMYLSPVIYSVTRTGGLMRAILVLNPMTPIISNFRYALFGNIPMFVGYWIVSWVSTFVFLVLGVVLYNKQSKTFLDTI